MEVGKVKSLFDHFLPQYDPAGQAEVWENQRQIFKQFWREKILDPAYQLTTDDTDAIIRLLDTKARGHQKTDVSVARAGLYQGTWERMFDDLKNKTDLQQLMDRIFSETDDDKLTGLIDRLHRENKKNKNGLTGKGAIAINALLFINDPARFVSCISLSHRFQILQAFGLGDPNEFTTYGEQVILSNRRIIDGFRQKYGIEIIPVGLSNFLYSPYSGYATNVRDLWLAGETPVVGPTPPEVEEAGEDAGEIEFAMERHLEEFLVRNWEHTELGRKYELIEEEGELVSPQYRTDVGVIDLLVRDKETRQFVVIELKRGQTSDETAGQVARYKGWVAKNLAGGERVKGVIIARANDRRLQYALEAIPDVELFVYKVSFALEKAPAL